MRCRSCQPLPEEVARAADLLGRRWTLAILWASAEAGAVRFNEFKQTLQGIPPPPPARRVPPPGGGPPSPLRRRGPERLRVCLGRREGRNLALAGQPLEG